MITVRIEEQSVGWSGLPMTHANGFDSLKRRFGQQRSPDELKVICGHVAWSAVQHHTVLRLHLGQQGVPGLVVDSRHWKHRQVGVVVDSRHWKHGPAQAV
jgi:hypothetical protein